MGFNEEICFHSAYCGPYFDGRGIEGFQKSKIPKLGPTWGFFRKGVFPVFLLAQIFLSYQN
ncbi:MAG: hypothetical protein BGO52_00465 [Sphingobacteriales bacterium 44-61]|nr:MAG: hypothetical protein BGO52_00465 [Sphingobacteriales bacterium 44-61]